MYIFKARKSAIVASPLCLGNISKDWSADNMKKQDLMDMSMVLVLIIDVDDIVDIHKHLMKKSNIV